MKRIGKRGMSISFGRSVTGIAGLICAGIFTLSACSDMVGPTGSKMRLRDRGISSDYMCPECGAAELDAIIEAINELKGSTDLDCMRAGNYLEGHLWMGQIHRDYTPHPNDYGASDAQGNIILFDNAFQPGELKNTLAHEESHHWGWLDPYDSGYKSSEDATEFGNSCSG